ncbi:unnamed protein product [Rhodiola kirilowii]
MEDDDDFGDLYTDVLQSFPSTSQSSSSAPPLKAPTSVHRSIDLNLQLDEVYDGAQTSNLGVSRTLATKVAPGGELNLSASGNSGQDGNDAQGLGVDKAAAGCGNFNEENFIFDLEEETQDGNDVVELEHVLPGLLIGPGRDDLERDDAGRNDWDSDDSDDDLQIVLNDTSQAPMAMEMGGPLGDGQDEGFGIGVDGDGVALQHPGMADKEWGEDGAHAADGEKKEGGEAAKLNAGMTMAPKPGFVGHGYHLFHSQFKYVRPGAAPLQGAPSVGYVGAPSQVRPLVNAGPMAGRGRGDWRPPGMKNVPGMQKGYGGTGWGNNAGGRGFGIGLDFTLPSHKTVFEVDIDSFEEKPWNNPGVDITDFFNFGLTEESWKGYCKQLEQFRVESTMQSRIRVYESGRSEQDYDPDMPPELAAAATGVSENAAGHVNVRRTDASHIDIGKSSTPARPPIPTGRAIQVETGSGERPPSIDTRPPRIRDSDAIIEIVCEGFAEGQSSKDGSPQPSEHDDPSRTNHTENHESDNVPAESKLPEVLSSEQRRLVSPVKDRHHSEPSSSRGHTPVRSSGSEDRRLDDDSLHSVSRENNLRDDQKDGSAESVDGKENASVDKVKDDHESSADLTAKDHDDLPLAVDSVGIEDDTQHDKSSPAKNQDEVLPLSKRRKVGSSVNLPTDQNDGEGLKATRSGDSGKSRPGNSKEYQKSYGVGEEVIQGGHDASMRNRKRRSDDEERNVERRNRYDRHDTERSRDLVKEREDPYRHRDGGLSRPSYVKSETSDKMKERDSSEGVRQGRDGDPHSKKVIINTYRRPDPRLSDLGDDMGSKYSGKAWDSDMIEKEEHLYSRKQVDNGRGHHDKDVALWQRDKGESLKARHETVDDYRRRKNEENLRRDYSEKENVLLNRKESPSLRKREREDILDQRKRDDQTRTRESTKDHHSMRQKDEVWMEIKKNERPDKMDDRLRTKQYREESLTKRERGEVRELVRSGRGTEDKLANRAKEIDEFNDATRYAEPKRRDRGDDVHLSRRREPEDRYACGNQSFNHDLKSRKDRSSTHTDPNVSNNHKINDVKQKESSRNKEYDSCSQSSLNLLKRAKDDHSSHRSEKADTKLSSEQGNTTHHVQAHSNLTRKRGEEVSIDDEEQRELKKGRSKLERWASHKERDFATTTKSASSLKAKEAIKNSTSSESSVVAESAYNPTNSAEAIDLMPSMEEITPQVKDSKKDNMKDVENTNSDPVQTADQHLDTVAKLKKRRERFKLPMPGEKDTTNIKTDSEVVQLPSRTEAPPSNPEVKSERPPRKRRWISS